MAFLFHFAKHDCSRSFLQFRATIAFRRHIPILFYSTETALVDDAQKRKPSVSNILPLKKRPFSEEEQRSSFGKLVYRSPLYNNVYWCKLLSLSTSITTVLATPFIVWAAYVNPASNMSASTVVAMWTGFSSLFMFTPLLLDQLTKRFVLEMYYNSDRDLYTAVYFNVLLLKRALTFSVNDAKAAEQATAFLHTHTVGKHMLLLVRQGYRDAETRGVFESMNDRLLEAKDEREDDDDDANDEPAKATTDHHKRQQDQ